MLKIFKPKVTCIILKNGTFIKKKKVPITENAFTYDGGTFALDLSKAIYVGKSKRVLFYEIDEATPLTLYHTSSEDSKILSLLISRRALKGIFGGSSDYLYLAIGSIAVNMILAIILYLKLAGVF